MKHEQAEKFVQEFKELCAKYGVDDFLLARKQGGFVHQTHAASLEVMVPTFFTLLTAMQGVFEDNTWEGK